MISGNTGVTSDYVISYPLPISGVTGIRLEAMEDPSLPFNGPGMHPDNGNFVLTEMEVTASSGVGPLLAIHDLAVGQVATLQVHFATPFSRIAGLFSLHGSGPITRNVPGCGPLSFQVGNPSRMLPILTADGAGSASLSKTVAAGLAGATIAFHMVDLGSCLMTNPLSETVQ